MDLKEWIQGKSGILSVDSDFFTFEDEQQLAPWITDRIIAKVKAGVKIVFCDEHVDLLKVATYPVNFVVNFDYHMDCRIAFLRGERQKIPACNASFFEKLLSDGLIEKYIWAFPKRRRESIAAVYSSAFVRNSQPLLTRIHCISGQSVLDELIDLCNINFIFVCRSPDYATAETNAIFEGLRCLV